MHFVHQAQEGPGTTTTCSSDGDPLPWVNQVKHLGNLLQSDNSMATDIAQKRGKYIGKANSLLQEFH